MRRISDKQAACREIRWASIVSNASIGFTIASVVHPCSAGRVPPERSIDARSGHRSNEWLICFRDPTLRPDQSHLGTLWARRANGHRMATRIIRPLASIALISLRRYRTGNRAGKIYAAPACRQRGFRLLGRSGTWRAKRHRQRKWRLWRGTTWRRTRKNVA
jgi:hypothetical protein